MSYSVLLSLFFALVSRISVVRSQDCQLQVPADPLTSQGLSTPYVLTGCNQLDFANQGVFVEAAILDPASGKIQIYNPLVINNGMTPVGGAASAAASANCMNCGTPTMPASNTSGAASAPTSATQGAAALTNCMDCGTPTIPATNASSAAPAPTAPAQGAAAPQGAGAGFFVPPIVPTLPDNAVVGIWFGSNAASLTLTGNTGGCVNGLGNSIFGQFAYCNGKAWFDAAKAAVSQGLINLASPGTGSGDQVCPTTRDFRVVDQDQSDNVVTKYLLIGGNTLAQSTPDNQNANPGAQVLSNASDNLLITESIDPALGCTPFQNPCTTCPGGQSPALATDELVAHFFPPASGPALVPLNDPMVLVNGQESLDKVNLYRDGVGQPQGDNNNASATTYCQQFAQSGIFINDNQQLFANAASPAADTGNNLFTFLATRFSGSFGPAPGLGCTGLLNVANPVTLTMDGNGVVTDATINTDALKQLLGGGAANAKVNAVITAAGSATASPSAGGNANGTATSAASIAPAAATNAAGGGCGGGVTISAISAAQKGSAAAPTASGSQAGSVVPSASVAAVGTGTARQAPAAGSNPACAGAATVTVTVTTCPSQVLAVPTASAPATVANGGHGCEHHKAVHQHFRERSIPLTTRRMRQRSRIMPIN